MGLTTEPTQPKPKPGTTPSDRPRPAPPERPTEEEPGILDEPDPAHPITEPPEEEDAPIPPPLNR